ncbi:hypothetical protein B0H11DRAFT_1907331 [Mycena galericulata]|nr:hypothetical protein B0H11DRAFT_1907331 [Mycena galericulata]
MFQQCYPHPVQSIAVLILGRFGIPHLAIGQVLSGIWARQCSQPGGRFTDPVTPGACQRVASLLVPGPFRPQVTIQIYSGPSAQSTVQSHHFWRYQGFHLMDWHAQILTHTAVDVVAHEISETPPKSSPPIAWKLDCKSPKIALTMLSSLPTSSYVGRAALHLPTQRSGRQPSGRVDFGEDESVAEERNE